MDTMKVVATYESRGSQRRARGRTDRQSTALPYQRDASAGAAPPIVPGNNRKGKEQLERNNSRDPARLLARLQALPADAEEHMRRHLLALRNVLAGTSTIDDRALLETLLSGTGQDGPALVAVMAGGGTQNRQAV